MYIYQNENDVVNKRNEVGIVGKVYAEVLKTIWILRKAGILIDG